MGACYSTRIYLLYDDEEAVVDKIREYVESSSGYVDYPDIEITDLISALSVIFPNVYKTTKRIRKDCYHLPVDSCYEAEFDASYGWETVLTDMFSYISEVLNDGSHMYIWPDSDYDYLVIEDGQCKWIH